MLSDAVIALRFLQYVGAIILLGSSLFFIYGLPRRGPCAAVSRQWTTRLLIFGAALLLVSAILGLITQTGLLAGSLSEGFKADNLQAVIVQMNFGWSNLARASVAVGLLICLLAFQPSLHLWMACAVGGSVACASFAWMGHGAATEGVAGTVHLLADIAHSVAAAVWIGALIVFVFLLLSKPGGSEQDKALYEALRRFSGVGSMTVGLIVLTGLVNSWFLVGLNRLTDFWTMAYGQVLLAKLLAFVGMLGLAVSNRFRLTPSLGVALDKGQPRAEALSALRRSLVLETPTAFVVLGLVAWLGTMPPPSAG